ncbi:MAG: superoxide dismutase [Bacteroidetes bacterium]|nr:superoxide dismutase [Bacteroidota bacterium]
MKKENNDRREFLKKVTLAGAGIAFIGKAFGNENNLAIPSVGEPVNLNSETDFTLPPLPYAYDALEPYIDKQTMELHHDKHHQAYVDKLNKALADAKVSSVSLDEICKNISKYPIAVRNNGGGHYNHSMFWKGMKPGTGSVLSPASQNEPIGKIGDAIKSSFDSFLNFKTKFSEKALSVFGSGWVWLVINKDGKLELGTTPNQDNPLMDISELKGTPLIGLDVWEHAYYLKYQNKRVDYVNSWWNVVNWDEAGKRMP